MRYVNFQHGKKTPRYGWLDGERVGELTAPPFLEHRRLEADVELRKVKLLPPVLPSKIIGVGRNYSEHAHEQEAEIPEYPVLFLKPISSIIGPGAGIILPPQSRQVEHEAELAIIIGKAGRWIHPQDSFRHILGYTIANDVTARDLESRDGQWARAKGFDTFCPLGPWIDTEIDVADRLITCRVNGGLRQMASTREMIFSIPQLVAYISSVMTLLPGDVILTGTPAGVNTLAPGDEVEISIDGLGTLKNPVYGESRT